jgi:hypothetical protein
MDDDDNTPGPRHRRTESGGESMIPFGGMMGGGEGEVQQLRSELASTKSELTVAEKRVADAGRLSMYFFFSFLFYSALVDPLPAYIQGGLVG